MDSFCTIKWKDSSNNNVIQFYFNPLAIVFQIYESRRYKVRFWLRHNYFTLMIFPQSLSEDEKLNFMNKTVSWIQLTENIIDSCFVLNFGYSQPLPWPQVILLYSHWYISVPLFDLTQMRLTLDSQLHLTPGTGGLKVPSSCTVVIIAGLVSQI